MVQWVLESADAATVVASSFPRYLETAGMTSSPRVLFNSVEPEFARGAPSRREARQRLGIPEHHRVVGSNATFRWKKGVDHLRSLVGHLVATPDRPPLTFLLVGSYEGELEGDLRATLAATTVGDELLARPRPRREDLPSILAAMDVFVATSKREGMPNALLEAMACGVAVATTPVDGCVDLIENSGGGILLEPFDAQAGADAIARLLRSPEEMARCGELAREASGGVFSVERELREVEEIYAAVLA